MASFKIGRVQEDILRELSAIMREELKDPRLTPALTIVRAELSGDMGHCKAYVSSLSGLNHAKEACRVLTKASGFIRRELFRRLDLRKSPEDAKTACSVLASAGGFIRSELFSRLKLRKSPQLHFIADDSIAYAADISEKLNSLGLTGGNDADSAVPLE